MSNSPLLALPYLAASQAQKHVTVNEALSVLDGLLHLSVITRALATPPVSPVDGDRYLVAASPTGLWIGHAGQIALRMEGAWRFLTPRTGWRIWIADQALLLVFNGTAWIAPPAPTTLQNLSLLGVNATADATNNLAVNSSAVLFNNVGAGVQFKINKAAAADTASLLFQTGFSGRAEIGITGDDDFHFKVSATGSSFNESLVVAASSGQVTVKNTAVLDPQSADPATLSNGQLWYNSTTGKFRGRQNGASIDIVTAAASVADGDKGDITVSGSGSTWTIDNAVISNAKLTTVASGIFKARSTTGAGAVEDVSGTQATALLDVATVSLKGLMAPADFTKLIGVAAGATANSADATLLARANHTGMQLAATISDFASAARATVLTGLSLASSTAIAASDTVLAALGQLQAQISLRLVASNNLSDLGNAAAARSNLGLGTLATQSGTSSGTNTGDQTITLSGDATGSGTATITLAIAANAVANSKLAQMPSLTLKANLAGSAADPQDVTTSQLSTVLNISGLIHARHLITA